MYYKCVLLQIAVSFTLETDGNLPIGQSLKDAIIQIDEETNQGPIYYMINCAHPTHFNFLFGNYFQNQDQKLESKQELNKPMKLIKENPSVRKFCLAFSASSIVSPYFQGVLT